MEAGNEDIPGLKTRLGAWIAPSRPDVAGRFAAGAPRFGRGFSFRYSWEAARYTGIVSAAEYRAIQALLSGRSCCTFIDRAATRSAILAPAHGAARASWFAPRRKSARA